MMNHCAPLKVAVVGAGQFGRNHLRVVRESSGAELAGVYDIDGARCAAASAEFGCRAFQSLKECAAAADAAIVAAPTFAHAEAASFLLRHGLHVLVEKPVAPDAESARALIRAAREAGRVLQVGHLERFNPAVAAARRVLTLPLFFEIHRLNVFSPRSLDVDVVLDLMIHDIDLVLWLTGAMPDEIRAAGISVLSPKVDIANVRLAFASGCVANLTASRISTERVRKLRLFQPHEYISVDYARQDALRLSVNQAFQIGGGMLPVEKGEPLRLQFEGFVRSIRTGEPPCVTGEDALRTLEVALAILDKIEEHAQVVSRTLQSAG
jgi:predicted dehydrogenase